MRERESTESSISAHVGSTSGRVAGGRGSVRSEKKPTLQQAIVSSGRSAAAAVKLAGYSGAPESRVSWRVPRHRDPSGGNRDSDQGRGHDFIVHGQRQRRIPENRLPTLCVLWSWPDEPKISELEKSADINEASSVRTDAQSEASSYVTPSYGNQSPSKHLSFGV